jgi:hypothetical protein
MYLCPNLHYADLNSHSYFRTALIFRWSKDPDMDWTALAAKGYPGFLTKCSPDSKVVDLDGESDIEEDGGYGE